jgi:3-hydroxyacyl-CoA dehydrogenase
MRNEIKNIGIVGAGFTGKQIAAQAVLHYFIVRYKKIKK